MSKQDRYQSGYMDGLQLALRIVEEDGLAGLEKEIKFRGRTKINTPVALKAIEKALEPVKTTCHETFMIMTMMVLHDEFDFGPKRLLQFMRRWAVKQDCLRDGLVSWIDLTDWIQDYLKMDLDLVNMRVEGWAKPWKG